MVIKMRWEHIETDIIMTWDEYEELRRKCFNSIIIKHWNEDVLIEQVKGVRKIGDKILIKKIVYVVLK